ncbi:MAG: acyl-[acyl-carrier-protein] thioesterase [Victivallaceae bacterium]
MSEVKNVWRQWFSPRHSEVDRNGRVKLRAVFDYLQEAAALHAENLGCGMRFLLDNNKMWVLSRLHFSLARPLLLSEELTVETYPLGFSKLFAIREFRIVDAAGGEVLRGTSLWLLLAADTMRPLRPEANLSAPLPDNSGLPEFFPEPGKLTPPEEVNPGSPSAGFEVTDARIDLNDHLNNAEYAAMVHDALAANLGESPLVREIQVNFLAASKLGERIAVSAAAVPDGRFFAAGFSPDGQAKFHASGTLF